MPILKQDPPLLEERLGEVRMVLVATAVWVVGVSAGVCFLSWQPATAPPLDSMPGALGLRLQAVKWARLGDGKV